ncbi:DUF1802 family protein [Tundrisphaera lichenicola]|uniref:DUF1802 family protein n=1 Tax=Tundrisphaera lichenicola TaxID=2029860 RepID=UPI003EBC5DFC
MAAMTSPLPDKCGIAFKEWAGVCDALARGNQSLILRKGGVAEGPGGFHPDHPAFWLYPTYVHQAEQGLRIPPALIEDPTPGSVAIDTLALVEWTGRVDREDQLGAIADLHGWTERTIRDRFHYRTPGLWALGVRIFRLPEPFRVSVTPEQLGCKTWVPLESPLPTIALASVIEDGESLRRLDRLRSTLDSTLIRDRS